MLSDCVRVQEKDTVNSCTGPRAQHRESNITQVSLSLCEPGPPKWIHLQPQSEINPKVGGPPPQNRAGVELDEKWRLFRRKILRK